MVWEGNQSVFVDAGGSIPGGNAAPGLRLFTFPVPSSVGASANASFGHTASWQGIVSLVDANGAPVTGFSALSPSSGFDYAQGLRLGRT